MFFKEKKIDNFCWLTEPNETEWMKKKKLVSSGIKTMPIKLIN